MIGVTVDCMLIPPCHQSPAIHATLVHFAKQPICKLMCIAKIVIRPDDGRRIELSITRVQNIHHMHFLGLLVKLSRLKGKRHQNFCIGGAE